MLSPLVQLLTILLIGAIGSALSTLVAYHIFKYLTIENRNKREEIGESNEKNTNDSI